MRRGLAPALVALACLGVAPATAHAAPGDIAVADEGNWFGSSGRVLRMPSGGAASLLAGGAPLSDPWAVAVMADGALLVADEGAEAVFSIAPSGTVDTVVGGDGLQDPVGIALAPGRQGLRLRPPTRRGAAARPRHGRPDPRRRARERDRPRHGQAGKLLVADGTAVRRIDPGTGAMTTVAAGAPLDDPRDVAVALDGTLYVAGDRQVVRVDPATGAQSVLAAGPPLSDPRAIDIERRRRPRRGRRPARRRRGDPRRPRDRAKSTLASGGAFRVPAGLGVVGGAGVDPSGGGNGDPDGPAAPPDPVVDPRPGRARRPGTPAARPATGGGITVTLPDGTDRHAPARRHRRHLRHPRRRLRRARLPRASPGSARRASAPPAAAARSSRPPHRHARSASCSTSPRGSPSASRSSATSAASAAARRPQEPPPHRHALPQVDHGQGPLLEGEPRRRELRALPRPAQGQGAQARRLPLRDPRPRRRGQRQQAAAPGVPHRPLDAGTDGPGASGRDIHWVMYAPPGLDRRLRRP